jgi:hypothetical protein
MILQAGNKGEENQQECSVLGTLPAFVVNSSTSSYRLWL